MARDDEEKDEITFMIIALDIIGAIFSLLATIGYMRLHPAAWPLSMVAISIGIVLYLLKGIYGDCCLHIVYLGMTLYGWHRWSGSANNTTLSVSSISKATAKAIASIIIISITIVVFILKTYTDSTIPYLDAITTVLSVVAQWLTCHKIIQCWHFWFFVDICYVALYLHKGLIAHSALYFLYLAMAVIGYLNWKKKLFELHASFGK